MAIVTADQLKQMGITPPVDVAPPPGSQVRNVTSEQLKAMGITPPPPFQSNPLIGLDNTRSQQQRATDVLAKQGVDTTTGLDAGTRVSLSLREFDPKVRDSFLKETFPQGSRDTPAGLVVKQNGKEILVDESGITLRDFADLADAGVILAGGAAGVGLALAAAPITAGVSASLAGVALISALSAQGAGAAKDVSVTPDEIDNFSQILKTRGVDAAFDFVTNLATAGAARFAKGAFNVAKVPIGNQLPVTGAVQDAAKNLGVPLDVSTATGSPGLARAQGLVEKIPGGAGVAQSVQEKTNKRVREIVGGLTKDVTDTNGLGQRVTDVLTKSANEAEQSLASLKKQALDTAHNDLGNLSLGISDKNISVTDAATNIRTKLTSTLTDLKGLNSDLYDSVFALPDAKTPFINAKNVRAFATKEIKKFPTQTRQSKNVTRAKGPGVRKGTVLPELSKTVTQTSPAEAFLPKDASSFLKSLRHIDNMTLEQAIKGRAAINEAIDGNAALADVGQGALKKVASQLTSAIEKGTSALKSGELKTRLLNANQHYKDNLLAFRERGIAEFFNKSTEPGFKPDSKILNNLFTNNEFSRIKLLRDQLGSGSEEWRTLRRSVFTDMMASTQDSLNRLAMDPKKLLKRLDKMSPDVADALLGTEQKGIKDALRNAVSAGDLNLSRIEKGSGFADIIRQATKVKNQLDTDYKNKVIGPFIKGELDSSAVNPEDFVNHFMRKASTKDINTVFQKIGSGSELASDLKKQVIVKLLDKSIKASDAENIISQRLGAGNPVGDGLTKVLTTMLGENTQKKLLTILGKETVGVLNDLGTVATGRALSAKARGSVGGIVAGMVNSQILLGKVIGKAGALPSIIKYRIASSVLASRELRPLLGVGRTRVPLSKAGNIAAIITPQIYAAIRAEFKNDPELGDSIIKSLPSPGELTRRLTQSAIDTINGE